VLGARDADAQLDRSSELESDEERPDDEARISFAVNFVDASTPPPQLRAM